MTRRQRRRHLRQIVEAAEEAQIVALGAEVLRGDEIGDAIHRALAIPIARRKIGDRAHVELIGGEGRFDVDPHARCRQAERIGVKVRGRERRRKERDAVRARQSRREMRRGNHVAQAERGIALSRLRSRLRSRRKA